MPRTPNPEPRTPLERLFLLLGAVALAGCAEPERSLDHSWSGVGTSASSLEQTTIRVQILDDGSGPYHAEAVAAATLEEGPASVVSSPSTPSEPLDPNEEVLREADALLGEAPVELTVTLQDPPADWQSFAGMREDDVARHQFIEDRRILLQDAQRPLTEWLAAQGYSPSSLWLVNQVQVTVPARLVRLIYERPDVVGISASAKVVPSAEWDGYFSQYNTLLSQLQAVYVDGRMGNRTNGTDRIRIGIMEAAMLNRDHLGWKDWQNGPTRIASVKDCGGTSCISTSTSGGSNTEDSHGTLVTWVAAGSIQGGQDATFPGVNTVDQRRRSGHLPESIIYFYTGLGTPAIRRAIDQAVLDGVDVLNLSLQCGTPCSSTFNASGINEALATATNAGMLVVAAGGNLGSASCTVNYPALRTHTLAVNGLDTSDTTVPYNSTGMLTDASRGGMFIRTSQGALVTTAAIDLTAPGSLRYRFWHPSGAGLYWPWTTAGSSVATPVVSGAAGALRNAFREVGWTTTSAKALMVNMLLLGDAWDTNQGSDRRVGVSDLSGAGRLRMHSPSALSAPAGWGWRAEFIVQGQWKSWSVGSSGPEDPAVTQWKWAALWFEPDLQNVANIDFYVYDLCPPSGGIQLVASDESFDLRMRMNLLQSEISGRCLQMYAYGRSVPSGGREFWSADYYHSGNTSYH